MQSSTHSGRRGQHPALPRDLNRLLTREQKFMLHRMETCGWQLAFVRCSLPRPPLVVLLHPSQQRYCVLEQNGAAVRDPEIPLRH
jgi:hypothetical protein